VDRMSRRVASSPDGLTFRPLSGRRLFLARLGWLVVFAVTIGLFSVSIPAYYDSLVSFSNPALDTASVRANLEAAHLSIHYYATYLLGISVASALVWVVVGTVIFWRRSDNLIALFASLCLITFGTFGLNESALALPDHYPAVWLPVRLLALLGNVAIFAFVLIFPNGRFVPRWTRWAIILFAVHEVFFYLLPASVLNIARSFPPLDIAVLAIFACITVGSQLYRYRQVSSPLERQQTKWVVFGVLGAGIGVLAFEVPISGTPFAQFAPLYALAIQTALVGCILLVPLSIGIAILRYRLWDIDVVINRTLVYGALSAIVVALYTLIVVALGMLFQARADLAVSLVATGVVAVLFAPLRERLQRGANRLMYGERDDPYAVLSRLGRRLEATIAPKAALETIVETVAQALKVPYAAINLRQDDAQFTTGAEHGTLKGEPLILPLVYQRETVGNLIVAPRAPGEIFSPADVRLLEDLARQVEVVVHAVRLTADLQHSRERLVTTREEERRRLRRDLHDGLGPTLGYLTLGLDTACRLFTRDPKGAEALLLELKAHTQEAISEVRRLVYGLRPPALDDLGLIPAIRQQAANHGLLLEDLLSGKGSRWANGNNNGLVFSVNASEDLPLLPAAVEVACYRIAQEAIANATRHSGASSCHVSLSLDEANGSLELEVEDDGVGVAKDRNAGVGMSSMRERAEELGGTLTVETLPEGGTRVLSRLPLSQRAEE
jgi:signal transduction histidine kinase